MPTSSRGLSPFSKRLWRRTRRSPRSTTVSAGLGSSSGTRPRRSPAGRRPWRSIRATTFPSTISAWPCSRRGTRRGPWTFSGNISFSRATPSPPRRNAMSNRSSTSAGSDMTSRAIVKAIVGLKAAPRCGLWLGNPHADSWPGLHRYFGTTTEEEFRRKLGDDYRWISPSFAETTFPTKASKGIFNWNWEAGKASHGQAGPLAEVEKPAELDRFDWPDPAILDFSETLRALDAAGPHYRASGFWTPFFHDLMDFFGMEAVSYTHLR